MDSFKVSDRVQEIVKESVDLLNAHSVPISKNVYFYECTGSTRYGYCTRAKHKGYDYSIAINKHLVKDEDVKNVVIHELLHTIPNGGATAHAGNWRKWADFLNLRLNLNLTVSARKQLEDVAYKRRKARRKYFDISEYDKKTMEIVECPSCHKKMCLKKGAKRYSDGASYYICTKCNKPFYFSLPKSQYADVNLIKRAIFVDEYVAGKIKLNQGELLSCMPYLSQKQCNSIVLKVFERDTDMFLDKNKVGGTFVQRLIHFASADCFKDMASLCLDDEISEINHATREQINALLSIFKKTKYYNRLVKHYRKR